MARQRIERRRAFTLAELLVVMAIVGILVAIVLPAVERVREASYVVACGNNLRQIASALHQHHDSYGVLPTNGVWNTNEWIPDVNGNPTRVYTRSANGQFHYWGIGNPKLGAREQTGSWLFSILPFVEQQQVFESRSWTSPVSVYICPGRRDPLAYSVAFSDACGEYNGGGWSWGKTDYSANAFVIGGLAPQPPSSIRLVELTDGTSNTILAGEKAVDLAIQNATTWCWDEPFFLGGSGATGRDGVEIMPDAVGNAFRRNWGSAHQGGAQFIMGDASVRLINYDVSWQTVSGLLTPSGRELPPNP